MKLLDTNIGKNLNELYKLQLNKEIDSEAHIDCIEMYLNDIKDKLSIKYITYFESGIVMSSHAFNIREVYYLDTESYNYFQLIKKEAFELQAINSYYLYKVRDIINSIDNKLINELNENVFNTQDECYIYYNRKYNGYCLGMCIAAPIALTAMVIYIPVYIISEVSYKVLNKFKKLIN